MRILLGFPVSSFRRYKLSLIKSSRHLTFTYGYIRLNTSADQHHLNGMVHQYQTCISVSCQASVPCLDQFLPIQYPIMYIKLREHIHARQEAWQIDLLRFLTICLQWFLSHHSALFVNNNQLVCAWRDVIKSYDGLIAGRIGWYSNRWIGPIRFFNRPHLCCVFKLHRCGRILRIVDGHDSDGLLRDIIVKMKWHHGIYTQSVEACQRERCCWWPWFVRKSRQPPTIEWWLEWIFSFEKHLREPSTASGMLFKVMIFRDY